ncbi:type IV pilus secretin PilQ [Humidesulfovibrio idahonensis]
MNRKPTTILGLLVALLAVLAMGCAAQNKPSSPVEDAADTWKAMEKQSQGHSPRGKFLLAEPPVVIDTPEGAGKPAAQPKLPTTRMSLRMHNADVVAVLQALSRAAARSVVISPGVVGTINVNIVERPWDEIFTGILAANRLTYSFDGETIRVMAAEDLKGALDLETIRRKTIAERSAAMKEEPLVTSVAKVRFADAKQLQKTVEATLTKDKDGKPVGNIQVDELTNALIIQSVAPDISKVSKLLSRLDAPRAQIKLKAHIVETTKEVARDLGILWGGSYTGRVRSGNNVGISGAKSVDTSSTTGTSTATVGTGNLGALGVSLPASAVTSSSSGAALDLSFGKVGGNILETQLQALATENKLNIISSPSISTMDNQKAYTEAGERVPYQTVTGTGTNVTYSVNFQDAVLRLEITPHIIDDEFIKLTVLVQKDEVDTSRTVSGNPYIVKKKTETTLIARNGETVVISGLSKLRNKLTEAGVPGVMDIPGAGWLAKSQSKDDLKDEFMIFITPAVLADWKQDERQKSYEELEQELASIKKAKAEAKDGGQGQNARGTSGRTVIQESPLSDEPVIVPQAAPRSALDNGPLPLAALPQELPAAPFAHNDANIICAAMAGIDAPRKARAAKPALGGLL